MKKKILFVITKSNWGGAGRYVYDLATNLPHEQFEVAVAVGGTGQKNGQLGALAEKLSETGIRTIFIQSFMRDISIGKDLSALRELIRIFKDENPDIVHLNSSKAGGIGAFAARLAGVKKIIFTAHGWPFWEPRSVFARGAIRLASWATMLLAHTTICISDYDLRVARRMPLVGRRAIRIYNGINLHMPFGSGEKIRSSFPQGARITGTIGELNKNKNQIALIEQARKKPDMYVALIGDGELQAFLEGKIREYGLSERVKLFGFIPADEVLKGFDIFALPSLKEGLPYVLLEARAAGLPIEANRIGGVSEILDAEDMSEFSIERMVRKTTALYLS